MARYNSVSATSSVSGGGTITTPSSGLLTTLTGPGTVTIPNPVLYAGQTQTYYNSGLSNVTLSTPNGLITGGGVNSAATLTLGAYQVITLNSDGSNYIIQGWLSGSVFTQSLTATGGTINAVNIGSTTAGTGAFTTLSASGSTSVAGLSASGTISITNNAAVTLGTAATGALQVTGGVGVAGGITVASDSYFGGKIGIGNISPYVKLHVEGSATVGTVGTERVLLLGRAQTTAVSFNQSASFNLGRWAATDGVYHAFTRLDLALKDDQNVSDYNTNNTVMTWQNNGYVGIGLTGPTAKLDVKNNTTGAVIRASVTDGAGSSDFGYSWYIDNTSHELAQINASYQDSAAGGRGDLAIKTRNYTASGGLTTKIYITGAGNVGIGTTTPSTKLHVYESAVADVAVRLTPSDPNKDALLQMTGQGNDMTQEGFEIWYVNNVGDVHISTTYPNDAASIHFHTKTGASKSTSNERLTILGSGNVGIGKTSPAALLDVNGQINTGSIYIQTAYYSASYTYSSAWASSLQTIVPVGTIGANTTYIVDISTDSYGGPPYYSHTSFLYRTTAGTNGAGTSAEQSMLTSHHIPSSTYWAIAATQALASQNGLSARLVNGPALTNTIYVRLYALTGRP